ncbi:putative G-protein coupled receptor 160 [Chelonoidis abingdonii]|uniref:G protein-coupled receptor 160 n=1 Tax=Chelonoidis abingdonii TaxID=106734 RepID=A0A8C0GQ45_CHEAB|nr:probable G-protein coupled receptor 160 [Chelonoidis abingdonii]XP_032639588.1 probable G-protein coupled receptor 160 [Chelonoidis abingdonii]XP_032639589.1 probable G-protein coupled receptor 160 [Chelonoidis abingdonii]XP_032639590.1 probable G-protein coupled receptor 160 [Chelonoidis abingdonii]XP_032639591.1 probable G-protein coupled receptor 160 [Chelonoidis abingdonii]XP_032639592.1 probable G-protein coupled receptor 160 [Chelonoidis abingdonii]
MAAISCANCSLQYYSQLNQPLEASCVLLLIMLGKVSLNLFMLGVRRWDVKQSFMGYFCISLALLDFTLLVTIAFISYFEDFALWGVRFTKYHICLFTQIISLMYGVLHYPVCLVSVLDYYMTVAQTRKPASIGQRLLYILSVIFIWISVLFYILKVPAVSAELEIQNHFFTCPFYISVQSYWLSLAILFVIGVALVICWSEVITMVRSVRIISFTSVTVLIFSYASDCDCTVCKKQLLTRLLICFLGTWTPFVFLQMIILLLGAQIPAYMEMNVPWLYFINSFLIATAYWFRCHDIQLTEGMWSADPFVSWKFCFIPFNNQNTEQAEKPGTEIIC